MVIKIFKRKQWLEYWIVCTDIVYTGVYPAYSYKCGNSYHLHPVLAWGPACGWQATTILVGEAEHVGESTSWLEILVVTGKSKSGLLTRLGVHIARCYGETRYVPTTIGA